MFGVRVMICQYVDDAQPGWVECRLVDVHGTEWSFVEKAPVVTAEDLNAYSMYPVRGFIACEVVERRLHTSGREGVLIDTERPWQIAATSGRTRFEVWPEELVEIAMQEESS